MDEKTVVIGAHGRIGRLLAQVWMDRLGVRWVSRNGEHQWSYADGAAALTPHLKGVSDVLCLAGVTPYDGADLTLNTKISCAVLQAAAGQAQRVFLASSAAVYGDGIGPHHEDDPARPMSEYGQAKLTMEQEAIALGDKLGITVVCLRIGNMVGADMLSRNVTSSQHMVLDQFSDGLTPRRSFIDPKRFSMIMETLLNLGRAGEALPNVLNTASQPALAMADLLDAAGVPFETRDAPYTAKPEIAMDLKRLFNLVPTAAFPVTAGQAIAAWRACEVVQ